MLIFVVNIFFNLGALIFPIWGLPEVILEAHFGILEAPERLETHSWSSKFTPRSRLCKGRLALASQSGPLFGDPWGGFMEAILSLWKASWKRPKDLLEASGGLLEASGEPLGGSWRQIESIVGTMLPEKLPRCTEERPKTPPKRPQENPRGFQGPLKESPKGHNKAQKATKTNQKLHQTYKAQQNYKRTIF